MRIRLETDAFYLILQGVQDGSYEMITSPARFAEVQAINDVRERIEVLTLLRRLGSDIRWDLPPIRARAEQLSVWKFGVADAAHPAFAEASADYFITRDDKLLKKCKSKKTSIAAMNPVDFAVSEDLR